MILYRRRVAQGLQAIKKPRVYADEEEKARMAKCHSKSVILIKQFLQKLKNHTYGSALEAACGDA